MSRLSILVAATFAVFSSTMFSSNSVSAASITLTTPTTPLSVTVAPTAEETFFESDATTIKVKTDSLTGYSLNVKANSPNFTNETSSLTPITSTYTSATFASAAAANTWGYLPSVFNGANNSDYQIPSTTDTLIKKTDAKTASEDSYTFKLGVKVNSSISAGTYTNTFTFTAAINPFIYSITYDLNEGTNGPKDIQSATTLSPTITLDSTIPTRDSYRFKGWCTEDTTDDTCSGNIAYQPGETIALTEAATTLELHAMWEEGSPLKNLGDLGSMQNFSCSTITDLDSYGTVTDSRDGETYTIAKLKDNNCWMTQNLRLGKSSMSNRELTPNDTNITQNYTLPNSSTSGLGNNAAIDDNLYVDENHLEYGGYYTWAAATAITGNALTSDGQNASNSICPKGWHLPTKDELTTLIIAYGGGSSTGSAALRALPVPSFVLSGEYSYNSALYQNLESSCWSSTAYAIGTAYRFYLKRDLVNVSPNDRYRAYSIRCITTL